MFILRLRAAILALCFFAGASSTAHAAIVVADMISMDVTSSSVQNGNQIDTTASGTIASYSGLPFDPTGADVNLTVISDLSGIITGGSLSITSGGTNYLSGTIGGGGFTFVSPSNLNNPTLNFNVVALSSTEFNVLDIVGPVSVTLDLMAQGGAMSIAELLAQNNFTGILDVDFEYQVTEVPLPGAALLFMTGLAGLGMTRRKVIDQTIRPTVKQKRFWSTELPFSLANE